MVRRFVEVGVSPYRFTTPCPPVGTIPPPGSASWPFLKKVLNDFYLVVAVLFCGEVIFSTIHSLELYAFWPGLVRPWLEFVRDWIAVTEDWEQRHRWWLC